MARFFSTRLLPLWLPSSVRAASHLFDLLELIPPPSTTALVFEDKYLEISTQLSDNVGVYGLGEHKTTFRLPTSGEAGQVFTLLAKDHLTPEHRERGE